MAFKTYLAPTFLGKNTSFPGTDENPMRPLLAQNPQTGEVLQVHYNDRNLCSDKDYEELGLRYINGHGWCYPITVEVAEGHEYIGGIKL